ncbi:MAG: hypothetical protein ABI661_04265 [Gammaproteobacteria bacterium]
MQAKKAKLDLQALGSETYARQQDLKAEMGLDEDDEWVETSSSRTSDGHSRPSSNV